MAASWTVRSIPSWEKGLRAGSLHISVPERFVSEIVRDRNRFIASLKDSHLVMRHKTKRPRFCIGGLQTQFACDWLADLPSCRSPLTRQNSDSVQRVVAGGHIRNTIARMKSGSGAQIVEASGSIVDRDVEQ